MKNWWIRFGCFLTGHNYQIVRASSEVAVKAVKRYTSALIIVGLLWFFVGYMFTERYLHQQWWGSLAGGCIAVMIILQIERQIILSISPSKLLFISRGLIATVMAILGAIIVDQIIFKEDIELKKITHIKDLLDKGVQQRTVELNNEIEELNTAIQAKETERTKLIEDVGRKPTIPYTKITREPKVVRKSRVDPSNGQMVSYDTVIMTLSSSTSSIENPKQALIDPLNATIANLHAEKVRKEAMRLHIRTELEKEIRGKTGFLDELDMMYELITGSNVALSVWLLWAILLFALEMLVLISKGLDKKNDYDKAVTHHMELQIKRLNALAGH